MVSVPIMNNVYFVLIFGSIMEALSTLGMSPRYMAFTNHIYILGNIHGLQSCALDHILKTHHTSPLCKHLWTCLAMFLSIILDLFFWWWPMLFNMVGNLKILGCLIMLERHMLILIMIKLYNMNVFQTSAPNATT